MALDPGIAQWTINLIARTIILDSYNCDIHLPQYCSCNSAFTSTVLSHDCDWSCRSRRAGYGHMRLRCRGPYSGPGTPLGSEPEIGAFSGMSGHVRCGRTARSTSQVTQGSSSWTRLRGRVRSSGTPEVMIQPSPRVASICLHALRLRSPQTTRDSACEICCSWFLSRIWHCC